MKGGFVVRWINSEGQHCFGHAYHSDQTEDLGKQGKFIIKHILGPLNPNPVMVDGKQKQTIVDGIKTKIIGYLD